MNLEDFFKDKVILITGGGGSLGQTLTRHLLNLPVKTIRLLDNHEDSLVSAERLFADSDKEKRIRYWLGDIRDKDRVKRAVEKCDIIIHTAALKHIHLGEITVSELVKVNVEGTMNMIEATLDEATVGHFIFISTDKCLNPSAYGVSKRFGEALTIAAINMKGDRPTVFSVFRPVNFYRSHGSVMGYWDECLAQGKPLPVTDPDMQRYFIPIDDVATDILRAIPASEGEEIWLSKNVKELNIYQLAKQLSENIVITGRRPGEVLREKMWTEDEASRLEEKGGLLRIKPLKTQ